MAYIGYQTDKYKITPCSLSTVDTENKSFSLETKYLILRLAQHFFDSVIFGGRQQLLLPTASDAEEHSIEVTTPRRKTIATLRTTTSTLFSIIKEQDYSLSCLIGEDTTTMNKATAYDDFHNHYFSPVVDKRSYFLAQVASEEQWPRRGSLPDIPTDTSKAIQFHSKVRFKCM